jgi:hypothetical protein
MKEFNISSIFLYHPSITQNNSKYTLFFSSIISSKTMLSPFIQDLRTEGYQAHDFSQETVRLIDTEERSQASLDEPLIDFRDHKSIIRFNQTKMENPGLQEKTKLIR